MAVVKTSEKRLAFDTNFLLDLAEHLDFAHTLREVLVERGYHLFLSPTVLQELMFKAKKGNQASQKALLGIRSWNFTPYNLKSVGHGITDEFAKAMFKWALIPEEEYNDALVLAEVSLFEIPLLVTSDNHLLEIDRTRLRLLMDERHLPFVEIIHPMRLLNALEPRKRF